MDGLIHITDLSWGRVNHPEEIVHLDEKLNVVSLDFDDAKKRIALGLKQLSPHPWDALDPNLKVGDKVKGRVVVMADYGAVSYTHLFAVDFQLVAQSHKSLFSAFHICQNNKVSYS